MRMGIWCPYDLGRPGGDEVTLFAPCTPSADREQLRGVQAIGRSRTLEYSWEHTFAQTRARPGGPPGNPECRRDEPSRPIILSVGRGRPCDRLW
jgi:hypothetical protein